MKSITLLIFCLFTTMLNAQKLTPAQALDFAKKLYQIEILSKKGRDTLIHKINTYTFSSGGITMLPGGKSMPSYEQDIRLSYILKFCAQAFGSEFYFRSGLDEEGQKVQDELFNGQDIYKLPKEEFEKISEELDKRKALLEGPQIEKAIPIEDFLPKDFGYTVYPMFFPSGQDKGSIHKKRSIAGKTRTRLLNDLLKIGLINQHIYDETLPKIKSNALFLETYLLDFVSQRAVYYEDFEENKKEELDLLNNLKNHKILSEDGYNRLIASYKPFEIKSKSEYIAYCNDALVFNSRDYSQNPEEYYPLIFNAIKKILPDFNYKNLTIKLTENPNRGDEFIEQRATISFEVNGITYKNTFWQDLINKDSTKENNKQQMPPVRDEFHKGINKWLADINSDKRLYFANNPTPEGMTGMPPLFGDKVFGLILLDQQQFKAWGDYMPYFMLMQSHDNTFNTEGVQKIIREYEQIGLFSHLSKTEIDSAKLKVDESEIKNYQDILLCFPKNIVYFDLESGNLENPYEELTLDFAATSRGVFTPTEIIDNFLQDERNDNTKYGFTFKGKLYETNLKMNRDWLDLQFLELIKQALKEQNIDGDIYYCLNNGQEAGYIFLNKTQYDYLKKYQPKFFEKRD